MTASLFEKLALSSDPKFLEQLVLKKGIDVNNYWNADRNLLMHASALGHGECVLKLIELGADVNVSSCSDGYTALIGAASENHTEVVSVLLNSEANFHHADKSGRTALGWAELCGCEECAALLRKAAASPLWSSYVVTELLDNSAASTADNSQTATTVHDCTWLGYLLMRRGVNMDHVALCDAALVQQEGFCTSEVFAEIPAHVLTRDYLASVGIHQLGVQQVLLQLHADLQRGLSEDEILSRFDAARWSRYTVSESTSEVEDRDTASCSEDSQFSMPKEHNCSAGSNLSASSSTSESCIEGHLSDCDSTSGNSSSRSSTDTSSSDDTSSSSDTSSSDTSTSTSTSCSTGSSSSDDSINTNTNTFGEHTSVPYPDPATSTANTTNTTNTTCTTNSNSPTPPTSISAPDPVPVLDTCNNYATVPDTAHSDHLETAPRCTCLCVFCPAGRQGALRYTHTILLQYPGVVVVFLASIGVSLVVGHVSSCLSVLRLILILILLILAIGAEVIDQQA